MSEPLVKWRVVSLLATSDLRLGPPDRLKTSSSHRLLESQLTDPSHENVKGTSWGPRTRLLGR
mgnify:CR=1 FL=1